MEYHNTRGTGDLRSTIQATTLRRIRGEFLEMPGLRLTIAQASKLWALDRADSERLLNDLTATGFLSRTSAGTYLRVSA